MYWISQDDNGMYHCACRIQDGTEYWHHPTLQEAIESMISGAYILNHNTITQQDITFCLRCRRELGEAVPQERRVEPAGDGLDYLQELEEAYARLPENFRGGQILYPNMDPIATFHALARSYLPGMIRDLREQTMLLHDLQEESLAVREAIYYREALQNILDSLPAISPHAMSLPPTLGLIVNNVRELAQKALEKTV